MRDVVLVGLGTAARGDDPTAFLRDPKEAKYLGLQDRLAVVAAGRAARDLALEPARTGLFLAVGHLPFDLVDIQGVLAGSLDDDGQFSLSRFTTAGWTRARPLLAFKCLPNLAAYHVSRAIGAEGPCTVTYPGAGQLHGALEDAVDALADGRVDAAVVGGVAAQRNWLVEHHHARLVPPVDPERLVDAAGFLVLRRGGPGLARLVELGARYAPVDPRAATPGWRESDGDGLLRGPAALPIALARAGAPLRHEVTGLDGVTTWSTWEPA